MCFGVGHIGSEEVRAFADAHDVAVFLAIRVAVQPDLVSAIFLHHGHELVELRFRARGEQRGIVEELHALHLDVIAFLHALQREGNDDLVIRSYRGAAELVGLSIYY